MQTFITIIICVTALVSVKAFEDLLERHATLIEHEVKKVRTFAEMGPDISHCYKDDVPDFAACVINLPKRTQ